MINYGSSSSCECESYDAIDISLNCLKLNGKDVRKCGKYGFCLRDINRCKSIWKIYYGLSFNKTEICGSSENMPRIYSKWAVVYALLQYVQNTASSNKTSNHFPANCKFYWANNNNDIQLKCTHNVDVPRCANWLRFMHTSTASILFHSDPLIFGIVHRNPQRNINILQIFVNNVNKCCMLSIAYFSNAIDTLYEFYLPFSYDCPCRTARAFKQNIVYTLQSSGRLAIILLCLLDAQRIISGSCMKVKILSKKSPHYIHSNGAQRTDV